MSFVNGEKKKENLASGESTLLSGNFGYFVNRRRLHGNLEQCYLKRFVTNITGVLLKFPWVVIRYV